MPNCVTTMIFVASHSCTALILMNNFEEQNNIRYCFHCYCGLTSRYLRSPLLKERMAVFPIIKNHFKVRYYIFSFLFLPVRKKAF